MNNVIQFPVNRTRPGEAAIKPGDFVTFKNGKTTIRGPVLEIKGNNYLIGDLNVWNVPKDLVTKG